MDEKQHSLFTQKQELLKRRKQLLDIKSQLEKDVHIRQPVNFGRKFGTLPEGKALSIADRLPHKFPDVRFLQPLECHMLFGLKVLNYDKYKLVVQFRPSYLEKILPDVYVIYLLAGINGYSVKKYYLPYSVEMKSVVQRWSPLKKDNLKSFLLDIKQQINASHHRENQVLELKELASNQNLTLQLFHPPSFRYIVITTKIDDSHKRTNCAELTLVFHYDSNSYLPTTVVIECNEMTEEDLAAAQEQFCAFKTYYLREASQICFIKKERFSLSAKEPEPNGNLNEEDSGSVAMSSDEDITSDSSSTPIEQVNKENRLLPIVEEARMSKSKSSTKGRRNRNKDNSPSDEEVDIAEATTSDASEEIAQFQLQSKMKRSLRSAVQKTEKSKSRYSTKTTRNVASKGKSNTVQTKKQLKTLHGMSKSKSSTKGRRNRNKDNSSSDEEVDITEATTSDASEKYARFQLQLKMKRSLRSAVQKTEKSKSRYSTKTTRNVASKGKSNTVQTKKQLKTLHRTDRKAPKKVNSPDDTPDNFLHTRKNKTPHDHSTNKITKEVPTLNQANKITRYMVKPK